MIQQAIERLTAICDAVPAVLYQITEAEFARKPAPNKWSGKQIIGHLIDSAANNHHRFVRGQFEDQPYIKYDQDNWNNHGYYQDMPAAQVIGFWEAYNRQLVELWKRIPENKLQRKVNSGGPEPYTLEFLINDYVDHMEHHLRVFMN